MDERTKKLMWLQHVIETTNESASTLARNAGFSDTTISRFINPKHHATASIPKDKTLDRIAIAHSLTLYTTTYYDGLGEMPAHSTPSSEVLKSVSINAKEMFEGAFELSPYRHSGRALELEGIRNGDLLFVDHNAIPVNGDIICVQLRDEERKKSETIFRLFHNNAGLAMALTATSVNIPIDQRYQLLDGINAVARGVVKYQLRQLEQS